MDISIAQRSRSRDGFGALIRLFADSLFAVRCSLSAVRWSLVAGRWSLRWSLVAGRFAVRWSLVVAHASSRSPLAVSRSPPFGKPATIHVEATARGPGARCRRGGIPDLQSLA